MLISVSRDGMELGEWPKEQVLKMLKEGQLNDLDFYWHQDLDRWQPLRKLLKPPCPRAYVPPHPILPGKVLPDYLFEKPAGIGRLAFWFWFVTSILVVFILAFMTTFFPNPQDGQEVRGLLTLVDVGISLPFITARLKNIGLPWWLTWFSLVPIACLVPTAIGLFAPTGAALKDGSALKLWAINLCAGLSVFVLGTTVIAVCHYNMSH